MKRPAGRGLTARDIMHRQLVTLDPELTIPEVRRIFLDRQVTGAPVVDEEGRILGVVSQTDLIRYQQRARPEGVEPAGFYQQTNGAVLLGPHDGDDLPRTARVEDIMTPAAFMTRPDAPVPAVARFMLRRHVHRLIVADQGRLLGIVTSMDLLRALLRRPRRTARRARAPARRA